MVRRTKIRWIVPLLAVLAGSALAKIVAQDPVTARGFTRAKEGREVTEKAIADVNILLNGQTVRFEPAWEKHSGPGNDSVPVYLVAAPKDARVLPAAVPRGCTCVFVNPVALDQWIATESTGPGRLALNAGYLLAFMLLHEAGHLSAKTAGAAFANGEWSELNVEPSLVTASEESADGFAADILRTVVEHKGSSAALKATSVMLELGNLSWNLQAKRQLDNFGATVTHQPAVFVDPNLSHPNLEWRMLRADYLIRGTLTAKALLDAFEDARNKSIHREPLYDKF